MSCNEKNILKDKSHNLEPFNIHTLDELCDEASRLNVKLPVSRDISILRSPVTINRWTTPNRLCVQPMEGCDADAGGVPGELTFRRYRRYAEGGFGLIWVEATAVEGEGRSNPRQLWLNKKNVSAFAELVQDMRKVARQRWGHEIIIILQLAHAGRYSRPEGEADPMIAYHDAVLDQKQGIPANYPVVSDSYLDRLQTTTVAAGRLAMEAGFDGVDIKASYGDLLADLLSATKRPGQYGGSLENRSRFLCEVIGKLRASHSGVLIASRFSPILIDSDESEELARSLESAGVQLLSLSAADDSALSSDQREHPLEKFVRLTDLTQCVQQAVPEIPVVAGGLSWFRHFIPDIAAALLHRGAATLIGIGRAALAYPALAGELLQSGKLDPDKCCINCDACVQLIKDGGFAGCVVMDSELYGAEYRLRRHFALDNLREEARRCRGCEPAPCRTGCPTHIDIPAFLEAFAENKMTQAYDILRKANVLPGMCSHLCPVNLLCEGRCVAGTLDGLPIPIHDIQHAVCWNALQNGLIGIHLPELDTGKNVAVVGGGPAGVSCAITLLERGHHVVILDRSSRLGGTPELAIRSSRFSGALDEIKTILWPALCQARLLIRHGVELGCDIALEELRQEYDAVFLATGVWGEQSLGSAEGVVPGVNFLALVRAGRITKVPERVILLAGGDSAMDSAKVALELGATELLIVSAGSLADMHWHMSDSWFRTQGVHFLTMTRPICYRVNSEGKVTGLKIQRTLASDENTAFEEIIEASLVVEAMGLGIESSLRDSLAGCIFTEEGLLKTEEHSYGCGVTGVFAGGGMINGGDSVVQCIAEGMQAGREMDVFLAEPQRA